MRSLAEIPLGQSARVREVLGPRAFRRRLMEMGLVGGVDVKVVTLAPLGDPIQIEVRGGQWSIRRAEAAQIPIDDRDARPSRSSRPSSGSDASSASRGSDAKSASGTSSASGPSSDAPDGAGDAQAIESRFEDPPISATAEPSTAPRERLHVVLAGNPNVGKTTLFNALTGSTAKVSNYPGITVERRRGELALTKGVFADVDDIPGTYSVNARSSEEQIAIDGILGLHGAPVPDVVVVCIDATSVARSAYLLMQLQELGVRCVVALTMIDEAKTATPEPRALADLFGCEVVGVTARTKHGLADLVAAIDRTSRKPHRAVWRWRPSSALADHVETTRAALPAEWTFATRNRLAAEGATAFVAPDNALALWALTCIEPRTGDDDDELDVPDALRSAVIARGIAASDTGSADGPGFDDEAVLGRWRFLDREVPPLIKRAVDRRRTQRIDRVLLHRAAGFGVFAAVMTVVFMSLFWGADPMIGWIEAAFGALGDLVRDKLGSGIFTDFIVDGVIGGVGSVIVFLPQIMLLFLFLGFLEDCGYLARIAYLMDRVMRSMNLHGRAFVPMLSGFACAIPAILATRTMERRRDRILTMMVVPLMTCSARLPVYTLVIAALLPGSALVQALVMVGMYLFSVITALAAAWVMSKTVKPLKAKRLPFLIELPPYRLPRVHDVVRSMRTKSWMFLREAGTVILACSIALWALLYFPRELPAGSPDFAAMAEQAPTEEAKKLVEEKEAALRLENSYGGRIGHAIEPAIAPLGFDWKIGVGIVGAFAAREVFVSTLGIVFGLADADEEPEPLRDAIRDAKKADGTRAYTPLMGLALMIFFALACQCMSTLAVVRRETGTWRWPAFLFGYMTVLAWVMSFLVYQGGRLLGFS
ncbi:MAG: FeoB small GTPase domain-containing protein [Kofleriaceae bacterium]